MTISSAFFCRFAYPRPQKIDAFKGIHDVSSSRIIIVDAQTLLIPSFSYDGSAPDAHFHVGKGGQVGPAGSTVPDENGSLDPLRRYQDKTLVLVLPNDLTIFDIGNFFSNVLQVTLFLRRNSFLQTGYLSGVSTFSSILDTSIFRRASMCRHHSKCWASHLRPISTVKSWTRTNLSKSDGPLQESPSSLSWWPSKFSFFKRRKIADTYQQIHIILISHFKNA